MWKFRVGWRDRDASKERKRFIFCFNNMIVCNLYFV